MPKKSGLITIVQIKNKFPGLPIFSMTGKSFGGSKSTLLKKMKNVGADRSFSKPFDFQELLNAVYETIGKP